uniref:Cytochrome c oxidase subunit 3 n=1 Tax=Lissachatina fulica TaxID=2315439 RepID=A0A097J9J4_LISFU|nr:cytochrome c oxidase subunit III [Lissachatina fulica]AIE43762.1 cytochrome c oxidase subunit III [Lissachatina fulica]AIT76129.1 cytochrome c oxidase subunit 3 [Lissachatina fulica]WJZ53001.1 cytochrome c oxidase subunit III [Lissachatina fulica]
MMKTPFHLVEYSPWPLLASMSVMSMPIGLVMYIRHQHYFLLTLGLLSTTIIAYLWWRDIVRESTFQGHHTSYVCTGLKMGMALFILSEVCFFFGFFWAYFHSSLSPSVEIGSIWPPFGVSTLETFQVPLLNTCVLLLSGVSITWAHHSIEESKMKSATYSLTITLLLGLYFLLLQYGEYSETSFCIADSVYGSTFFMATGFHGLHVLIGASFIFICLIRLCLYHFNKSHHLGFLAAAWYWHFVDVVWLFLYVSVYWWGS